MWGRPQTELIAQWLRQYDSRCKGREALMWKITTRDFTLEEVLIMAAMNVVTRTDSDRQRRANGLAQPSAPRLTGI